MSIPKTKVNIKKVRFRHVSLYIGKIFVRFLNSRVGTMHKIDENWYTTTYNEFTL